MVPESLGDLPEIVAEHPGIFTPLDPSVTWIHPPLVDGERNERKRFEEHMSNEKTLVGWVI